ncbi:ABC transporter permease [Chitinivibrio alkaliphilus]|uniref:ABC transporter permease n=1 Tax=Chitinivibrio alkaliphilus TaxID=1505232 RepID=UPI000405AEB1|nr:ABC transporter permease [Chitinivibrio alkaliphilus]
MLSYCLKRIAVAVPLLFAISLVTYFFIYVTPGDVLAKYRQSDRYPVEMVDRMEREYRFNEPFLVQYGHWLRNLVQWDRDGIRLNLGYSFSQEEEVAVVMASRLKNTLILALFSIAITWLVSIPGGIIAAVHQYRLPDKILSCISYVGISFPNFFLALVLLYLVSVWHEIPLLGRYIPWVGNLPLGGMTSDMHHTLSPVGKVLDVGRHLLVPGVVIATAAMANLQRIMRGNMLETLRKQYIVTARAKGLSETRVVYKHALRNAINPLITIFGYQFSTLLSGAALTEIITGWPGMGSIMLEAIRSQDTFLVMANMLIAGVMLVMGNLIADILLAVSDPRIRMR